LREVGEIEEAERRGFGEEEERDRRAWVAIEIESKSKNETKVVAVQTRQSQRASVGPPVSLSPGRDVRARARAVTQPT
jgi:hypothetical protein